MTFERCFFRRGDGLSREQIAQMEAEEVILWSNVHKGKIGIVSGVDELLILLVLSRRDVQCESKTEPFMRGGV